MGVDPKRTYRKKKTWCLNLNITIETPELDHRLNESFQIEIGSNHRLKILQQTILSHVKNLELRELIKKEKMYIYIEGKEPVARKSKSLAEMGVKDGDNLIVTTEMKLPFNEESDEPSMEGHSSMLHPNMHGLEEQYDMSGQGTHHQAQQNVAHLNQFQGQGQRPQGMGMNPTNMRGNELDLPHAGQLNVGITQQLPSAANLVMPNHLRMQQNKLNQNPQNMHLPNVQEVMHNQQLNQGQMKQQPKPQMQGSSQMSASKDINRKQRKPTPSGEKRKDNQPKSPAMKKPKEAVMVKLFAVQQHYKSADLIIKEEEVYVQPDPTLVEDEEKEKEQNPEKNDGEQIDSNAVKNEDEDGMPVKDDRQEEKHEKYVNSQVDEQEEAVVYDPNDVREVEVNIKNKMRSLKKNILDMIGLFKKANIILLKMEADKSYRPFTEDELE